MWQVPAELNISMHGKCIIKAEFYMYQSFTSAVVLSFSLVTFLLLPLLYLSLYVASVATYILY